MAAGSIVVDLLARTGSFETDINRSTKAAEKRMREMQRTISDAGVKIGLAMGAAGLAAAAWGKSLIDGLDQLNDLADATGSSIEAISALEDVALRAGGSMDTVSGALLKFNQVLNAADEDSKAAKALEAIGLNAEELRRLDPAEGLLETARALDKFADDGNKGRIMLELFGKATKDVAAFMKDLAEKGELSATVMTQQTQAAEAFNKQLAAMQKNATDLGRSLVTDLMTGINKAAAALRESGLLEGFRTLVTGDDRFKNDKRMVELTDSLLREQNELSRLQALDAEIAKLSGRPETTRATEMAKARVKALQDELKTVQAMRQVLDLSFKMPELPKPSVGAIGGGKDTRGRDTGGGRRAPTALAPVLFPDSDFGRVLESLDRQAQSLRNLSHEEEILGDLAARRIELSTDPMLRDQEEALLLLAGRRLDVLETQTAAERERLEQERQATEQAEARLRVLVDDTPSRALQQQLQDIELLNQALANGTINAQQFQEAMGNVTGKTAEMQRMTDGLADIGGDAFRELVKGGRDLDEVFGRALQRVSDLILEIGVIEPLVKQLKETLGSAGGVGGIFSSLFSSVAGGLFGGGTFGGVPAGYMDGPFRANGGPVEAGRGYIVGERGPEWFQPRTAGMVLPNHALGGGGGNITLINQTRSNVDRVQEHRMPDGSKALLLQELGNPNSDISRTLQQRYGLKVQR